MAAGLLRFAALGDEEGGEAAGAAVVGLAAGEAVGAAVDAAGECEEVAGVGDLVAAVRGPPPGGALGGVVRFGE
jgi:hypothetical protein